MYCNPRWYVILGFKSFYTFWSIYQTSKSTHLGNKRKLLKNKEENYRPRKERILKSMYELNGTYKEVCKEHLGLLL